MLLFQVHAKTTSPDLTSFGMSTLRVTPAAAGQLPMNDLITLNVDPPSSEMDSWQEPPLWIAEPSRL